jgi:hypothetical protein
VPDGVAGTVIVVFVMLALIGSVRPASARQYGAGDINYLVSLWDTNRAGFKGTVQGIDTFSALGTVDTITSKAGEGNAFDVIVDVGLSAQVSCTTEAADVKKGDSVTVSGRIASATTAVSQMSRNDTRGSEPRPRDTLGLQSCTVQKALRPK